MKYIDSGFGRRGGLMWLALPGAIAAAYAINIVFDILRMLYEQGELGLLLLFLAVLSYLILILFIVSLAIYQGRMTIQELEVDDVTGQCSGRLFFGKKISFTKLDVISVKLKKLGLLGVFKTPLGRGGVNLEIKLLSGVTLFVNSSLSNFVELPKELNQEP